MLQKNTFDWMRQQLNGFMRTQIIAAAATLSLADHLQNEPRTVEEIASITGLEKEMTFRLLRALAAIGLVASEDEHTFYSLPPLETLLHEVPGSLRESQWALQRRVSICHGAISFRESKREYPRQLRTGAGFI